MEPDRLVGANRVERVDASGSTRRDPGRERRDGNHHDGDCTAMAMTLAIGIVDCHTMLVAIAYTSATLSGSPNPTPITLNRSSLAKNIRMT